MSRLIDLIRVTHRENQDAKSSNISPLGRFKAAVLARSLLTDYTDVLFTEARAAQATYNAFCAGRDDAPILSSDRKPSVVQRLESIAEPVFFHTLFMMVAIQEARSFLEKAQGEGLAEGEESLEYSLKEVEAEMRAEFTQAVMALKDGARILMIANSTVIELLAHIAAGSFIGNIHACDGVRLELHDDGRLELVRELRVHDSI